MTYRIGVIGYSAQKFDLTKAFNLVEQVLNEVIAKAKAGTQELEIVSGWTDLEFHRWLTALLDTKA